MNLDRVNMMTLRALGLTEAKPPMPHDLRRLVEGLRSGKSYDPHHVATVIESLHTAYVSALGGAND
jgi:hypothetical protein